MEKTHGHGRSQGGVEYFQSFNASHFTHPSSSGRRPHPTYTTSQKDEAIHLLNEGISAKKVVGQIGGSCSKSNPYRWRAEELERERQREAEQREHMLRHQQFQQQARAAAIAPWFQHPNNLDFVLLILMTAVQLFVIVIFSVFLALIHPIGHHNNPLVWIWIGMVVSFLLTEPIIIFCAQAMNFGEDEFIQVQFCTVFIIFIFVYLLNYFNKS